MGRILEAMFGAWLLLGLVSGVSAQGVVNYPPASGNMVYVPPSYQPASGRYACRQSNARAHLY